MSKQITVFYLGGHAHRHAGCEIGAKKRRGVEFGDSSVKLTTGITKAIVTKCGKCWRPTTNGFMKIQAKFVGSCASCGAFIAPRKDIHWHPTQGVRCLSCGPLAGVKVSFEDPEKLKARIGGGR